MADTLWYVYVQEYILLQYIYTEYILRVYILYRMIFVINSHTVRI